MVLSAGIPVVIHAQNNGVLNVTAPTPPPAPELNAKSFTVYTDYGEGNAIANSLRNSPPKLYRFDRASLRDVLRFLADDAGIPFISMQERIPGQTQVPTATPSIDDILVTFSMRASPFLVLESIAKANDIALIYENGVWFIRPFNEQELFGRIYRLRYTPQERVVINSTNAATAAQADTENATASIPNLQLQQSQSIFQIEEPTIVREIRNMLRIPSSGVSGKVAAEASVENFPPMPGNSGLNPAGRNILGTTPAAPTNEPTVTFNSDTNTIYIVATRQQHQWVEGFLAAADRPQALIGIEVKFFETTKNPIEDLGINWAGTLEDGYSINLSSDLTASGNIGADVANVQDNTNTQGSSNNRNFLGTTRTGAGSSSGVLPTNENGGIPYNYSFNDFRGNDARTITSTDIISDVYNSIQSYNAGLGGGFTATLQPDDVSFAIEAFMSDSDTTLTQYPRVLTVNNREVAISNARNQPILGSASENSTSGSSTTATEVQYLPIGTQLNILPKTMPDGSVFMNVAITVSSRGNDILLPAGPGGQLSPYPITFSRIYQAALQVDSGYTLAVGGLEEATDVKRANGVVGLANIPGLGSLFRSEGRNLDKRNLVVFITPTIINDRRTSGGISEQPQAVLPIRPGDPTPPAFGTDGRLAGGYTGLDNAFAWLSFQNRFFEQLIREGRVTKASIDQLEGVIRTAEMVLAEIEYLSTQNPSRIEQFAKKEEEGLAILNTLRQTLIQSQEDLF